MLNLFIKYIGAILIMDIVLMGSGAWSSGLGLPLRWLLFSLICLASMQRLTVITNKQFKDRLTIFSMLLSFAFIWVVIVPLMKSIHFFSSFKDGIFFIALAFIFFIANFCNSGLKIAKIEKFIVFSIFLLSLIHIGLGFAEYFGLVDGKYLAEISRAVLEPNQSENTQVMVGYMFEEEFRVFWISSMFLFIGFAMVIKSLYKVFSWENIAICTVLLVALYFTKTRSLMLASVIFPLLFYLVMVIVKKTNFRKTHLAVVVLFLVPVAVSVMNSTQIIDYLGLGREISDNIRINQQEYLIDSFLDDPILGAGFGSSASEIRSEDSPWSYELNMLALLMKIGLIGVLFLYVIVYKIFNFYAQSLNKYNLAHSYTLLLLMVFIGSTNPMLFNIAGLLVIFIITLPLERDLLINES